MLEPRIVREPWAVTPRLRELFDATKADFFPIIKEAVGAKADYVPENDPVNAPGQFMYIHGVRNMRAFFRTKGWLRMRERNVELVRHPERSLMVGYQTVDLAAVEEHLPQAISGKGTGASRMVDQAQLSLFSPRDLAQHEQSAPPTKNGLWHLCVSANDDDVRAELSLFSSITDGNFSGCHERIFLLEEGEWGDLLISADDDDGAVEFEPFVRRK